MASELGLLLCGAVVFMNERRVTLPSLRRVVSLSESVRGEVLGMTAVIDHKFWDNASSQVVSSSQWLIVHLCRGNRYSEMILLK